jgi:hypothetical protein
MHNTPTPSHSLITTPLPPIDFRDRAHPQRRHSNPTVSAHLVQQPPHLRIRDQLPKTSLLREVWDFGRRRPLSPSPRLYQGAEKR